MLDTVDLELALIGLTDRELSVYVARMAGLGQSFLDTGDRRVAAIFHALAVLGAEQEDRRRHAAEAARVALDGDDRGGIDGRDDAA